MQAAKCNAQQSEDLQQLQRCRFLFGQALDADEAELKEEAIELYAQAVELSLKAVSKIYMLVCMD